jgi:thymidine phosphorylase
MAKAVGRSNTAEDPAQDLSELVLACAAHLLVQTRKIKDLVRAREEAEACLASGAPRKKWDEMLTAQGSDLDAFSKMLEGDCNAPAVTELKATRAGFVTRCDAHRIGEIVRDLGAGRVTKESMIDHRVGVDQIAKHGQQVPAGSILARIQAKDRAAAETARDRLAPAFEILDEPPPRTELIAEVVTGSMQLFPSSESRL